MWLSLVEYLFWEQGVTGSNPVIPKKILIAYEKLIGESFGLQIYNLHGSKKQSTGLATRDDDVASRSNAFSSVVERWFPKSDVVSSNLTKHDNKNCLKYINFYLTFPFTPPRPKLFLVVCFANQPKKA